ncbi:uncharacterized protein EV422DRAFT_503203 [Fimicolochytrium jonesii]|uniref:uncharacterized protein n=1 Tax=Fimicolochytrium jonesii TaxID=1396493 RepID=UPI0022FECE4C|nr:uncharacterized protein EV422DRAFT_503203 [Fimicolochytrium jonesii]KAI8825837.1 hypothetical protein EV422DRAFT_503203 [Fimicolochytrium jonesii]
MTLPEGKVRRAAKRKALSACVAARQVDKFEERTPNNDTVSDHRSWECCGAVFPSAAEINRHVQAHHQDELEKLELGFLREDEGAVSGWNGEDGSRKHAKTKDQRLPYTSRRAPKGQSDSITLRCTCPPSSGLVLLFYRYTHIRSPTRLAEEFEHLCGALDMTGKIRVSAEGINITVAGKTNDVERFIGTVSEWDVLARCGVDKGEDGETEEVESRRRMFFKPSEGCEHVFDGLSVKVVDEVCPFGVKGWSPKGLIVEDTKHGAHEDADGPTPPATSSGAESLRPSAFHSLLQHALANPETHLILDTRNHYETALGHFPTAHLPPIRKFSSLPEYITTNSETLFPRGREKQTVLTYCTGGVRCEKAARWIWENVEGVDKVVMLEGGIHNYLEWIKEAERSGTQTNASADSSLPLNSKDESKTASTVSTDSKPTSLFLGHNYVFDARQSLGLDAATPITHCKYCDTATASLGKCVRPGCHLLVTVCEHCQQKRLPAASEFSQDSCTEVTAADGEKSQRPGVRKYNMWTLGQQA